MYRQLGRFHFTSLEIFLHVIIPSPFPLLSLIMHCFLHHFLSPSYPFVILGYRAYNIDPDRFNGSPLFNYITSPCHFIG